MEVNSSNGGLNSIGAIRIKMERNKIQVKLKS